MIVCCESDPLVVGFLCSFDGITAYEPNTWVDIEGILEKRNIKGTAIPSITITKISKARIPKVSNVAPPTI